MHICTGREAAKALLGVKATCFGTRNHTGLPVGWHWLLGKPKPCPRAGNVNLP